MSAGTLARYTPIYGPRVPVKVIGKGTDRYGAVIIVRVTSKPTGSPYRKGETLTLTLGTDALSAR